MAKQAQIFEKTVNLPPDATDDRALLTALGNLSPKDAHHNSKRTHVDFSAICPVNLPKFDL